LPRVTPITLRLKELREARGLSQKALAKLAGVPQPTVNRIESGKRPNVGLAILEKLADALDVNAAVLIDHRPKPRRK
jgi:transcriptional regulator with XRE-family HTH domain